MTTSDKPAPEHPAPWHWEYSRDESDYETVALRDAAGRVLIGGTDLPGAFVVECEARETIRAAGEMAALLREIGDRCVKRRQWQSTQEALADRYHQPSSSPEPADCGECLQCRTRALLDRIDVAKAGG